MKYKFIYVQNIHKIYMYISILRLLSISCGETNSHENYPIRGYNRDNKMKNGERKLEIHIL